LKSRGREFTGMLGLNSRCFEFDSLLPAHLISDIAVLLIAIICVMIFNKKIWQKAISHFYHIRQVVARVAKFVLAGAFGIPIFGEGEAVRGSAMVPFERTTVVSYRFPIETIALSLTIRSQFAIECLRRCKSTGGGSFWRKKMGRKG